MVSLRFWGFFLVVIVVVVFVFWFRQMHQTGLFEFRFTPTVV